MAATKETAKVLAETALKDRGDPNAGEWSEYHETYHIRRRLSKDELILGGNLKARDIRGTQEEQKRLSFLVHEAPYLKQIITDMRSQNPASVSGRVG